MEKNVCGVDRVLRAALGLYLLRRLLRSRDRSDDPGRLTASEILTAYAVAEMAINVFAQWCPLNALLGVDTCRRD